MKMRVLILIALVLAAGVVRWQTNPVDVPPASSLNELPMQFGAWQGRRAVDYDDRVLSVLGVDDYVNRAYTTNDRWQANLYVGYYRSQQKGASIHSPLHCLLGGGWESVHVERVPFTRGAAHQVTIRKGAQRLLVVYWYQTPTRVEGNEYLGRFYAVVDRMRYGRNDAAMVRVTVPIERGPQAEARAASQAVELATLVQPAVDRLLFSSTARTAVALAR